MLEDSNIILRGGRIVELGPDSDAPMMSKKLKVKGLFATAGLTDLSSTLTLDEVRSSSAIHSAWMVSIDTILSRFCAPWPAA